MATLENIPTPSTTSEILDGYASELGGVYLGPGNALGKMAWFAEQQHYAATHDPMTGALNRAGLELAMENNQRPYAVIVFDGDHFKEINDTLGHANGDEAIKTSVAAIAASVREGDLVARIGGDEFAAVLFTDIQGNDRRGQRQLEPREQLVSAMKRVDGNLDAQLAAEHPELYQHGYRLTAGGVLPENGESFHEVMQAADAVMYVRKKRRASDSDDFDF